MPEPEIGRPLGLVDIDEASLDHRIVVIDLSVARTTPSAFFNYRTEIVAYGFAVLAGPTTGTLNLHPRKPNAPALDLTQIVRFPVTANSFYIENTVQTTNLTIAFFFNKLFLPSLAPSARGIG